MTISPGNSDQTNALESRKAFGPATIIRVTAVILAVLAGALILTAITSRTDYISYWTAGKLLRDHANPYSFSGVFALEKAQGYSGIYPVIMRNPPWALFIAAPLGFIGLRVGLFIWTLALMGCVITSVWLLKLPSKESAFAYVFAPAAASVFMGQSAPFLLLGFCLFLRLHANRPFLAGMSLLLMAFKPHLFLIFWVVLLVDCLYRRRFALIAGGVVGLGAASLSGILLDSHAFIDYRGLLESNLLQHEVFPTLSMEFRMLFKGDAFWLLFVPSILAVVWGIWYYNCEKKEWQWEHQGLLLMLVTILASPYGWFYDQVVLLPCIVYGLVFPEKKKYTTWLLLLLNTAALWIVFVQRVELSSVTYIWTPIAWLAWFLYATFNSSSLSSAGSRGNEQDIVPVSASLHENRNIEIETAR